MEIRRKNRSDPFNSAPILSLQAMRNGEWKNIAQENGKIIFKSEAEREAYVQKLIAEKRIKKIDGKEINQSDQTTEQPKAPAEAPKAPKEPKEKDK